KTELLIYGCATAPGAGPATPRAASSNQPQTNTRIEPRAASAAPRAGARPKPDSCIN
ncbi:hypothetical protein A2U01_0092264, partial [Trifolium medium]|nr:hypothetical protein [Trifolium medium]